ncbi:type VI secretion system protein TssL, long form [Pseudoalteromonas shioyasakiensis]|uniref:type VI secretion system protein TssL, long form n=1 Tax=Pseudoalteromonas shioyasakiensis TaxID=1190813 RepID=UPI00211946DF|nr:type VI secretion system protein TssL, long form [Pseudoalteromonas shioyasakiensis]MCQ8880539.1 type VI secretion system protein TssL, long form [Pseudoalteromonas shioyasakiensis]
MDETIIKPRPGRLGRNKSNSEASQGSSDKTVVSFSHSSPEKANVSSVSIFKNELLDAANDSFSLIIFINQSSQIDSLAALKHRAIESIKRFETNLRAKSIELTVINNARYCLCAAIDEAVLNAKWSSLEWAEESLLSTFHKETFGGEYFFTLLDEALAHPEMNRNFLELQYHCLNLGFKGKFRVAASGESKLEDYRNRIYHILNQLDGPHSQFLTPSWKSRVAAGVELRNQIPLWVVISVLALIALVVYLFFNMRLNEQVDATAENLKSVHPLSSSQVEGNRSKQLDLLTQLLHTEIQRGIVSVEQQTDRIRITINNKSLFNSGEATLLPSFQPILEKLALSLEGTKGKILITGHTDDSPISTSQFPSNWHLSLARATQVANSMAKNTGLMGRLWPEGKGSAEPLVSNTNSDKALNRRIEIDLLF